MSHCDLHCHSTASDGTMSPAEVVRHAHQLGLKTLALTDHDTLGGLDEAAAEAERLGLRFIRGIEISAKRGAERGNMHILGYGVDQPGEALQRLIEVQSLARIQRAPRIVEKLNALGVDITLAQVEAQAGVAQIGRPHIAAVLVEAGYAKSIQDAFVKYLGRGAAAYERRDQIEPADAIASIHEAGGVAVLAHPVQCRCETMTERVQLVHQLHASGLDGLETLHPDHTPQDTRQFIELAERLEIVPTGGSDFHGTRKAIDLGCMNVPESYADTLLRRIESHREG